MITVVIVLALSISSTLTKKNLSKSKADTASQNSSIEAAESAQNVSVPESEASSANESRRPESAPSNSGPVDTTNSVSSNYTSAQTADSELSVTFKKLSGPTLTAEFNPPFRAYSWTETSPYVFSMNNQRFALVSNSRSDLYTLNPGKSVMDKGAYVSSSLKFAAWPLNLDTANNTFLPPAKLLTGGFWRHVYYNAFGVYQSGDNLYSVLHGENKNMKVGQNYYRNTVRPSETVYSEKDYSTEEGHESWDNYFAFISMARSPVSTVLSTGNLLSEEYGPVVWPCRPYIDSAGKQVSVGTRHPSFIIADGYMYLYYTDNIAPYTEKVHCSRAKLDKNGKPGPFYNLYNGEFTEPSLPAGFNAADRSFFYKAGGRADIAVPSNNAIRFYPAKLKGTPYYIGLLEETVGGKTHQLKLLFSKDLKTWTHSTLVTGSERSSWSQAVLLYPMINDSSFCAGTEVDPSDFMLVGTTFTGGINGGWPTPQYIRMSVEIK